LLFDGISGIDSSGWKLVEAAKFFHRAKGTSVAFTARTAGSTVASTGYAPKIVKRARKAAYDAATESFAEARKHTTTPMPTGYVWWR